MDEAVVRIILEGDGGGGGRTAPSPPPPPPPPLPSYPRTAAADGAAPATPFGRRGPPTAAAFDATAAAHKRIEREEQMAAIDAEYAKLKPPPLPSVQPAFDPNALADKRREGQRQAALVDEAYKKKYGSPSRSMRRGVGGSNLFFLLRGTLGGLFGPLVGSILDLIFLIKRTSASTKSEEWQRELLAEAHRTTGAVETVEVAVQNLTQTVQSGQVAASRASGGLVGPPAPQTGLRAGESLPGTDIGRRLARPRSQGIGGSPTAPMDLSKVGVADMTTGAAEGVSAETTVMGGSAGLMGAMAGAIPAIAGSVALWATAVSEFKKLVGQLSNLAKKYEQYDPRVASAQAMADIRTTMGDLRRSQQAGAELAKYVKARTDLEQKYEDVKVKLLMQAAPFVSRMFQTMTALLEHVERGVDFAQPFTEALQDIQENVGAILDFFKIEHNKKHLMDDPTTQLLHDPRFLATSEEIVRNRFGVPQGTGYVPPR